MPKHHSTLSSNTLPILYSIDLRRPLRSPPSSTHFCMRARARPPHIKIHYTMEQKQRTQKWRNGTNWRQSKKKKGKSFSRQFSTSFQTNKRFLSFLFFFFIVSLSSSFINTFIFRGPGNWTKGDRIHSFRILYIILFFPLRWHSE